MVDKLWICAYPMYIQMEAIMGNAINLYLTDEDRSKLEVVRKALAAKGIKFTDQRGNPSKSALLRYLIDEKVRELSVKATP